MMKKELEVTMSDKPRIRPIDPNNTDGIIKLYFKAVETFLKRVPNSRRIAAHTPMVAMLMLPFTATLQREGAGGLLSSRRKEIAIIKTSHLNGCTY